MMPENWNTFKLDDVAEIIGGGTPSTLKEEYWNGEISWLTPRDLTNYNSKYISKGERQITEVGLRNSSAKLLPKGTVLLTSRAPIGYLAIAEDSVCTNQGFKSFILDKNKVDNHFFYYLLKKNVEYLKSLGTGTTFAEVSSSKLKTIEFTFPPIEEQRRIAEILSALDEKIELNLEMNRTLERIAQATFKHWFVDFQFPGFDGELVDGLPKGWKKVRLEDLVDTISATHKFPDDKIIFLNTSDISEGQVLRSDYSVVKTLPGQAKKSIKKDDILYSEIRPINKRFAYVDFDADDYVVSTKLMVLRAKSSVDSIVLYYFLKSEDVIRELQMLAESRSGTFPQITFFHIKNLEMIVPDDKTLELYTSILKSNFKKINSNLRLNQILTQIRNGLLPKLMSGKIRVA